MDKFAEGVCGANVVKFPQKTKNDTYQVLQDMKKIVDDCEHAQIKGILFEAWFKAIFVYAQDR